MECNTSASHAQDHRRNNTTAAGLRGNRTGLGSRSWAGGRGRGQVFGIRANGDLRESSILTVGVTTVLREARIGDGGDEVINGDEGIFGGNKRGIIGIINWKEKSSSNGAFGSGGTGLAQAAEMMMGRKS